MPMKCEQRPTSVLVTQIWRSKIEPQHPDFNNHEPHRSDRIEAEVLKGGL